MPARAGGTWSRPTWNRPIRQTLRSVWERADRARPKPTPEMTAASAVRRVGPTRPGCKLGNCEKFMSWGQVSPDPPHLHKARAQVLKELAQLLLDHRQPPSFSPRVRLLAWLECCQGSKRFESGCLFWPGVKELGNPGLSACVRRRPRCRQFATPYVDSWPSRSNTEGQLRCCSSGRLLAAAAVGQPAGSGRTRSRRGCRRYRRPRQRLLRGDQFDAANVP